MNAKPITADTRATGGRATLPTHKVDHPQFYVEGFVVYWNHGAETMYGWSRSALGKRSHDLLKTELPKPLEEITEELYRTDHWTGEFVHTTRDGRRSTVLARKALDRDREGRPAAILQTLTNITERKQKEEALSRITAIIDFSNDAILSKDLNGIITSWNAAAERLFGYTVQEAIGQPITLLIPPDQADEEPHILTRLRNGERLERFETTRRRKDGTLCNVALTVSPVRDDKGRIVGASKIVRDITERKRAQEALRESEERFCTMANSMPQLAWTARGDGYIHWYNQRWHEYTGTTPQEMEGWGWQSVHDANELPEVLERWKASIATGNPFEMTFPLRGADGVFRAFLTRVIPLKNAAGKVVQWFGTNTEINDMMLTQEKLVHAQAQLADRAVQLEALVGERTSKLREAHLRLLAEADERKRLEADIAAAVEGERERLGQELHDGLAQELIGIGMLLHVLERDMQKSSPTFAAEAGRLCRMLEQTQKNTRNLAKSFYPVELEKHGLLAALQNLAVGVHEKFGISCVVEAAPEAPVRLKDTRAVQLFRIAQEAIHNAAKHAAAKEVRVALAKRDGTWLLTIKDNGVGLPGDAQNASGMGLRIMHYRARMIGGTVEVRNDVGGGVLVSCAVPATDHK